MMNKVMEVSDREILLTREFDATPDLVFDAWTNPEKIGQWWGPNGFITTTHSMDFKPGGIWIYTMHGPDGTDYPNWVLYTEIVASERIVYNHGGELGEPAHFRVKVNFENLDGKTRLTHRMIFPSKKARDNTVESGALEGGKQTLNRLADYLKLA